MLSAAVKPEIRAKLDVGPMPRGGDSYTVDATGGSDNQASGGSLKIVADLDDWDSSVALNNPGQSGDPDSPHYRDLFELWSRGKYFPIFYSRPKVESVTEKILMMQPTGTPGTAQR
jgi:penicillin amidase